jgi:hypothetical protein
MCKLLPFDISIADAQAHLIEIIPCILHVINGFEWLYEDICVIPLKNTAGVIVKCEQIGLLIKQLVR